MHGVKQGRLTLTNVVLFQTRFYNIERGMASRILSVYAGEGREGGNRFLQNILCVFPEYPCF